ncbi:MAG: pyrroline-5-carboxylate reductase [Bryobacterales bacterium]|nr:pyrroline-5-carboxylate reductase [Bryobacterales bacterium]
MPAAPCRLAVLGAGNIGAALIGGVLHSGVATPETVVATAKTEESAARLRERFGIRALAGNNLAAIEHADVVVLAVKPALMPRVVHEIRWGMRANRVIVSLAAAFPIHLIEQIVGREAAIFRAMPNIPMVVEEGAVAIAHNTQVTEAQRELIARIFASIGVVCFVEEDHMHAVTALSGSGPAYIYMVIEAMIAGGLKMGLPHDTATRLAEQTVLGAAKLVRETGHHPAVLRDQVITPGGVTIAAVHELERHGLRSMLISAIESATLHSRSMSAALLEKFSQPE